MKIKRKDIIKKAIAAKGYKTVNAFSTATGIPPSSVYNIFNDEYRNPNVDLICRLSEALNIDARYLIYPETETTESEIIHNMNYCELLEQIQTLNDDELIMISNFIKYCLKNNKKNTENVE